MRVCQPFPVALKASNTSASNRMVVETFFTAALGRPRLIDSRKAAFPSLGETTLSPILHSPRSKNSSVSSGASSGSIHSGLEAGNFSFIGIPHRNDTPAVTAYSPCKYNFLAMQNSKCNETLLSIVASQIWNCHSRPREHLRRILKVEATLLKGFGALCWVVGDLHSNYCSNIKSVWQVKRSMTSSVLVGKMRACSLMLFLPNEGMKADQHHAWQSWAFFVVYWRVVPAA